MTDRELRLNRVNERGQIEAVPVTLIDGPSAADLKQWMAEWRDFAEDDDIGRVTADWDWVQKPSLIAPDKEGALYAIVADGSAQGLLLTSKPEPSRLHDGRMTLYAEYIESAPWNRHEIARKHCHFKGVGTLLLYVAICESLDSQLEGAVTLHSLPSAEVFYERRGMTKCRHEVCEGAQRLWLFEFDAAGAATFVEAMR